MAGAKLLLGITGSIAAVKAPGILTSLLRGGAQVEVTLTRGATRFVTATGLAALAGRPVRRFWEEGASPHLELAKWADLVLVAPASADFMGKAASGLGDELLGSILLATRSPVLFFPAMETLIYQHRLVQDNVRRLRETGYRVFEPARGRLASGEEGLGRLPEPGEITAIAGEVLARRRDLAGVGVLVGAGPTREHLDPVRFISSPATGKMGYALAAAAAGRGAKVVLVSGPTLLEPPKGVEVRRVTSAVQMRQAMGAAWPEARVVLMAAAVADFRPAQVAGHKIKKKDAALTVSLLPNPDILAELAGTDRSARVVVGFAAETGPAEAEARRKLREKGLDLVVANDVTEPGAGFEVDTNRVSIISVDRREDLPMLPKAEVAELVLDRVVALLRAK